MIVELFQEAGILQEFIDTCWPNGGTDDGKNLIRGYLKRWDRYQERAEEGIDDEDEDLEEEAASQEFALESDLRNYLAKNLHVIEPGLKLFEDDGTDGVEYRVERGSIDILAIDQRGRLVVIELKVSRGRNRTVGQILYYMGWVDANLAEEPCRGIIIANEISDDLLLACQRIPDISLYRYSLSVSVEAVEKE